MAEKFLDDSERLYGEPHPTRYCVRNSRRIVVKVSSPHCWSNACANKRSCGEISTWRAAVARDPLLRTSQSAV